MTASETMPWNSTQESGLTICGSLVFWGLFYEIKGLQLLISSPKFWDILGSLTADAG